MTALGLAWEQFRLERKLFWRNPSAAFFNFVLPLLLLLLIASVFADDPEELDVLVPGIAGMGVMATTFTALAFNLTYLREQGILKRVRGTPIPAASYLAGFLGNAVANAVAQVLLVVAIGHLVYDVAWPQDWLLVALFTCVGVLTFGALGVAFSHLIPNFDAAPAYTNAVFLPLLFISGAFYSTDSLPPVLDAIGRALPLKHVIDGLSAGIVGNGGVDELGALAIVAAWGVAGVVVAVRFFRWE